MVRLHITDKCESGLGATCKNDLQVRKEGSQRVLSGQPKSPKSLMGAPSRKLENSVLFSVERYLYAVSHKVSKSFFERFHTDVINLARLRAFNRK